MNIDYTELSKNIRNDKISFQYLEEVSSSNRGWKNYNLKGIEDIKVRIHKEAGLLELKANFAYYWQGHNFNFSRATLIEALNHTSDLLKTNLFQSELQCFEFGSIVEVGYEAEEFLKNHVSYKGKPFQEWLNSSHTLLTGKVFKEKALNIKLYDAGLNLKSKTSKAIREQLEKSSLYDKTKHYIKFENHYKKPNLNFKKRCLLVSDVLQEEFMQECKNDLLETYKSIMKTGLIKIPTNKKDVNAGTLPLILLKELGMIYGFNPEELMKQRVKTISEDILTQNDKKARQGQLKQNWKKISTDKESKYDILRQLESKEIL